MKIFKSSLALSVILPITAFASVPQTDNILLKPINDKLETQACYVAATQGIEEAKTFLQAKDYVFSVFENSISCNGMRISDFANKYAINAAQDNQAVEKQLSMVKLVALENRESQLCVDAVVLGEREARVKHDAINDLVYCNSKRLSRFARAYRNKNVIL